MGQVCVSASAADVVASAHKLSDIERILLLSYVPNSLIYEVSTHSKAKLEHHTRQFDGAILFIDIKGFTALSEKLLHDKGRRGVELLSLHVSTYFKNIISCITRFGGDVINFAGVRMQG